MGNIEERENRIMYSPRTGAEMERATQHKAPILMYSDLCKDAAHYGPARTLARMFKRSDKNIILLQDPSDMDSGHWISVSRNLPEKEIYFFSTYGKKPDVEKLKWMTKGMLRASGQNINLFNDGMKEFQRHGWTIYYNDYPYQKEGDNTATCGIFTAAFLRSGLDPDQFKAETLKMIRDGYNPAIVYYDKYFR